MQSDESVIPFPGLALKTVIAHTITYFLMGALASTFLNYAELFARPEFACWMRKTSEPVVMAGPLFQPIRGLVFSLVFLPTAGVTLHQEKRMARSVGDVDGAGDSFDLWSGSRLDRGDGVHHHPRAGTASRMV
jgi:hypothetical protein